jgi:hypothetical protein
MKSNQIKSKGTIETEEKNTAGRVEVECLGKNLEVGLNVHTWPWNRVKTHKSAGD